MTSNTLTNTSLEQVISQLNHKMTGSLARLEGLYLLYRQEGELRNDIWEQTLQQAKQETHQLLQLSFEFCRQHYDPQLKVA